MFATAEMANHIERRRSVTEVYQDANNAYKEGKWQDAIDGWYQVCIFAIGFFSSSGLACGRQ